MHGSRGAGPDKAGTEADPAVAELTGLDHAVTIQEHTLVQVVSIKKARAITLEGALQGQRELALKAGRVVVFLRERSPGSRSPGPHMGSELSARGGQTLLGNGALGSAHPRTVRAVPVVPISFRTCRRLSIVLLLAHSQGTPCSTTSMLDRARAYHGVSGAINRNFLGSCW